MSIYIMLYNDKTAVKNYCSFDNDPNLNPITPNIKKRKRK